MSDVIKLENSPFECAKVAVKRSFLFGEDKFSEFVSMSFDEILKFMEEHDFKAAINNAYLGNEGFYLIEKILNDNLSRVYEEVYKFSSDENKALLDAYFLEFRVKNFVTLIRCKLASEESIEGYLVGIDARRQRYVKAFEMPIEDAVVYLAKKINFDSDKVLDAYRKGIFELENYLYKEYYKRLSLARFKFNGKDEVSFQKFVSKLVDLLNARTFMKIKIESESFEGLSFVDFFVEGGKFDLKFFDNLKEKNFDDCMKVFSKEFAELEVTNRLSSISNFDKLVNLHKGASLKYFKSVGFGSPFYLFKYLFEKERELEKLRIILKGKYLKLDESEIVEMLGGLK